MDINQYAIYFALVSIESHYSFNNHVYKILIIKFEFHSQVEAEKENARLTADLAECKAQNAEFETTLADQKKSIEMLQAELASYKEVLIEDKKKESETLFTLKSELYLTIIIQR